MYLVALFKLDLTTFKFLLDAKRPAGTTLPQYTSKAIQSSLIDCEIYHAKWIFNDIREHIFASSLV